MLFNHELQVQSFGNELNSCATPIVIIAMQKIPAFGICNSVASQRGTIHRMWGSVSGFLSSHKVMVKPLSSGFLDVFARQNA